MRVLVTGGAGFLGSHLCEKLLMDGNSVICLDNLFTGDKSNIEHLLERTDFDFVRHDVVQPILLEVDWIFNLACPASPTHYQYNPVKTVKTSVMGALNMLGLAKRVKARILQASTSEVYSSKPCLLALSCASQTAHQCLLLLLLAEDPVPAPGAQSRERTHNAF